MRFHHIMKAAAVASVAALMLTSCSTPDSAEDDSAGRYARDADTLVLGMVPDQQSVEDNFGPLVEYIEAVSGKKVELVETSDYAALIEAAIAGRIDIGRFSGLTYVAATNAGAKLEAMSARVPTQGASARYESLAIAPAGSDITSIEDMKGRKICFVDPGSTSGYLYPAAALIEAGIDPATDIEPVFAGGHDIVTRYVAEGVQCEAGFAEDAVVERTGIDQGLFEEGDLEVFDRLEVPGSPIVISTDLPEEMQQLLRDNLSELSLEDIEAEGIEITDAFRGYLYALEPVTDDYYDSVRNVCELTEAAQCTP